MSQPGFPPTHAKWLKVIALDDLPGALRRRRRVAGRVCARLVTHSIGASTASANEPELRVRVHSRYRLRPGASFSLPTSGANRPLLSTRERSMIT